MNIHIQIETDSGSTGINASSFDEAIIMLIDKREWENFYNKKYNMEQIEKALKLKKYPQNEQARNNRNIMDNLLNNKNLNALKPKSNKRGGSFVDTNIKKRGKKK